MELLVTGANGYIGSQLVPALLDAGHTVRVLVRGASRLSAYPWMTSVQVIDGDLNDAAALRRALNGVSTAFYLVHSMRSSSGEYRTLDADLANRFATAAAAEQVRKIVYLGALGNSSGMLSEHLVSRQETGRALAGAGVPVLELRAGPIVGSGSLPFEMVRYLTERVPIMICPRWVFTKVQPIALPDALTYLTAAAEAPVHNHTIVEIGGSQVVSYGDMMMGYARVRGLRRIMVRVPVLTPRLSSYWIRWVTPLRTPFARQIVEGLRSEVIVANDSARRTFPFIQPMGYLEAVSTVLQAQHPDRISTTVDGQPMRASTGSVMTATDDVEGIIYERRDLVTSGSCEDVYESFTGLGGTNGWPAGVLWRIRAAFDRLIGGVGLRRTRENERRLQPGATLDFWLIERLEEGRSLHLRSEMKLPGKAWLEFRCSRAGSGTVIYSQRSYFAPRGLMGFVYWIAMKPMHAIAYDRMARVVGGQGRKPQRAGPQRT